MKKNIRNILKTVTCTSLIIASLTTNVFAKDWTVGRSYDWSPYSSTTATSSSSWVKLDTDFWFTAAGADINNELYFFTMEQNIGDGKPLDLDLQLSNLPDVGYDSDDDDKDGYHEESEAYHGSFGKLNKIQAYKDYYFLTYWDKPSHISSIPAGTANIIAQRSFWAIEMQAADYDLLSIISYGKIGKSLSDNEITEFKDVSPVEKEAVMAEELADEERTTSDTVDKTIRVNGGKENIKTVDDLIKYKENQRQQVDSLMQNKEKSVSSQHKANVVLTFNQPISVSELNDILEGSHAKLTNYEAKFVNDKGEWITALYSGLNEEELITKVNKLIEGKENAIYYEGVTSAKVRIELNSDDYSTLVDNENVFFADLSDELIRIENNDINRELKVLVDDYAWLIAGE